MPPKRATARRTRLERQFTAVFTDLVEGTLNQSEIARKYKVTPMAVTKFVHRNAEALDQASREVVRYSADKAISDKAYRLGELDAIYGELKKERETYGLHVVETTTETQGSGEAMLTRVIETREFRRDLVAESRNVLRAAAEELGDLPKPDQNLNIRAQVLLRQVEGTTEELG